MACRVRGAGRLRFPVATLRDIGRDLIIRGEYAGLLDLPLVHVAGEYEVAKGVLSYRENGKRIATSDYLHILWTDHADGRGRAALTLARNLYRIALNAERVQAEELSGIVASALPLPNRFEDAAKFNTQITPPAGDESGQPIEAVKPSPLQMLATMFFGAKGKTLFLPTAVQGAPRREAVPRGDYEQAKLQPRIDPQTIAAHARAYDDVLRALGVSPLMMSNTIPPTREVLRAHVVYLIDPIARLIEGAAAQKGVTIDIDTAPIMRFDTAGQARALGTMVQAGLSVDEALELAGFVEAE